MVLSTRVAFIFLAALGSFVAPPVWGRTFEFTVGVRESKVKVVRNDNVTSSPQGDLGVGVKTTFDFSQFWFLRQGLLWETRTYDAFLPNEHRPTAQYLDFTTFIGFRFFPSAGIFGGPSFKFLVAKDCKASGPCNIADDPVTFIAPIVIGADFRVIEHFAFEVFYEFTPGEIWTKNFTQGQTTGINFKYLY